MGSVDGGVEGDAILAVGEDGCLSVVRDVKVGDASRLEKMVIFND